MVYVERKDSCEITLTSDASITEMLVCPVMRSIMWERMVSAEVARGDTGVSNYSQGAGIHSSGCSSVGK